jgi:hypothetical protein
MDARVCLSDIDPTDANATRLVLGRRGDGGGGGGFMEAGIWKFLKPVARPHAGSALRHLLSSRKPKIAQNGARA